MNLYPEFYKSLGTKYWVKLNLNTVIMIIWLIIYLECMQVGTVTLKCGPVWVKLIANILFSVGLGTSN